MYRVVFTDKARKALKKLNRQQKIIIGWIKKNLEGCEDPRKTRKAFTANKKEKWRYRVGDYRILAQIQDNRVVILVLQIGHRREIYK